MGGTITLMRILQMGLGPIGRMVTRYLLARGGFEIVAAVDADLALVGRDLGDLAQTSPLGVEVAGTVAAALEAVAPASAADVAIVTTTSQLGRLAKQIPPLLERGLHVVSTCEELVYPWTRQPALAREIDQAALKAGVAVIGVGVNPGFLMDLLPIALSGICQKVESVRVERIQDAQYRRLPFQQKIGAGLTPGEFDARVRAGTLRHVGLTESMHMIGAAFGWSLDKTEEQIQPVLTDRVVQTAQLTVQPGQVVGVSQQGYASCGGERVIELVFRAAVGEPESYERILLQGTPSIELRIPGGVNGDVATGAVVVNAARTIADAQPGLRTMIDIPPICYRAP